jgi:hypothetical protein
LLAVTWRLCSAGSEEAAMAWPMSPLTERLGDVIAPIDEEEARRAIDAALAHVGGRQLRVHGAELRLDKRRRQNPVRQVTVWLADAGGTVHEVVIDADGNVLNVDAHDDVVLPFLSEEIDEAAAIAATQPEISAVVEEPGVARAAFYPTHATPDHHTAGRRVGFHYFDARDPEALAPLASVVVDLIAGQIEAYRDDRAGQ